MNKLREELCRICFTTAVRRDISDLKFSENGVLKSYVEVLAFCLDIQVNKETKHKKLCTKCYIKILSFYKFKSLALKNDKTLRSFNPECSVKLETFLRERTQDKFDDLLHNEISANACNNETAIDSLVKNRHSQKATVIRKQKHKQMCPECGKVVWNLRLHANGHLPPDQRKMYKCSDCDKSFLTSLSVEKHYTIRHLGIKKHCDICDKEVVSLTSHKRLMHERQSLQSCCTFCNKRFLRPYLLQQHLLIHTEDRPHECDICHKTFRLKIFMTRHKRATHDNDKNHLCQFCSKRFFDNKDLQIHLRSHTKEKPYKCSECSKFFSSPRGLKLHQVLHTGERKYQCHLCNRSFARYNNLAKHIVVHTKEKKYCCQYCDAKFGRAENRKRHELTAHEHKFAVQHRRM